MLTALAGVSGVLLIWQFGFPRDTLRVLGVGYFLLLFLLLLIDVLTWLGFSLVFHYPEIYAVILGMMGFTWPAFLWLSLLENPTQLHRKIMWRIPIIGAFLGHALGNAVGAGLFAAGWLVGLGLTFFYVKQQRYVLRLSVTLLFTYICYSLLKNTSLVLAQVFFALWILMMHKVVSVLLVKNHLRNKLAR
jgi:hypothetical protein